MRLASYWSGKYFLKGRFLALQMVQFEILRVIQPFVSFTFDGCQLGNCGKGNPACGQVTFLNAIQTVQFQIYSIS